MSKKNQNYELIDHFFREKGLVHQHIDSYNYFIEHELQNIMEANNIIDSDIDPSFYLKYKSIRVSKPTITENLIETAIYPQECRNRDLSYSGNIYVTIEYTRNKSVVTKENVFMGKLPIMVRSNRCHLEGGSKDIIESRRTFMKKIYESKECFYDNGGYFIINGCERVVMIQEQLSQNRIILENGNKGIQATVTSSSIKHKGKTSLYMKNGCFYIQNTLFSEDIPAIIVARACGIGSDKNICEIVGKELFEQLSPSFEEVVETKVYKEEYALAYLAGYVKLQPNENKLMGVKKLLKDKFLPNIGVNSWKADNNNLTNSINNNKISSNPSGLLKLKGIFVCFMMRRLALANAGMVKVDDKDFIGNKRFELAGQLLGILFEDSFKKFNFELKRSIDKLLNKRTRTSEFDALTFFNLQTSTITMAMNRAISSGNWNLKRFRMERSGVTSIVTRYSYICALGMMTKINSHFEKTRKISGPRSLHTSSWGMICPADTPEGESCGLVKNLALLTEITTDSDPVRVMEVLEKLGAREIQECYGSELYQGNNYLIFLNGEIYGLTSRAEKLVEAFRRKRRRGEIDKFVSIYLNDTDRSVHISTDNGRMCRPLIIVDRKLINIKCNNYSNNYSNSPVGKNIDDSVKNDNNASNNSSNSPVGKNIDDTTKNIINPENSSNSPMSKNIDDTNKNIINPEDSYNKDNKNISISTELKKQITFTKDEMRYKSFYDFIEEGRIEYLDVHEENNCRIAFKLDEITEETTHLEIAEFSILSYVAGLVPFPDHNQSPRNTYQCAMGKQAIGHIATNVKQRVDNAILQLNYTQRPIAASKTLDICKYNLIPSGINAMVAVMSYSGYDIEDALILNKASIDRGMARVEVYKTNTVTLKRYPDGQAETIVATKDSDGIISPGKFVKENSILVNKMSPITNNFANEKYHGLPGRIDKVMLTKSTNGNLIKIVTRETRVPEIGDKFSSRHGQKGVVGLIVPQEDMPFNDQGLSPDIIMNPHGYPSRMTVGKLIEAVSSKAGVITGQFVDATPFKDNEVRNVCEDLVKNGFSYSGKDFFYSGTTGEPFEAYIFYGPIFYQRLKHMVADKMHCRARGPRAILTRQPTEGRAKDGGLRLGEMERDCLIGYGASSLLNERLMISSDVYNAYVCRNCGIITQKGICRMCKKSNIVSIKMPYACKLLFQELMAMNILPKIGLS